MKSLKSILAIIPACLLLGACQPDELPPSDYVSWVKSTDNGLHKTKSFDDLQLSLQYKPAPLIAFQEARSYELTKEEIAAKCERKKGMQYFNFSIELTNGNGDVLAHRVNSDTEYQQRVNYYSFEMQQDLFLVQDGDTLPCKLFQFARNYSLAPRLDFAVAFDEGKSQKADQQFIWNDRVYGLGMVKMTITADALAQLPTPKVNA